jgi:hypothetical protein
MSTTDWIFPAVIVLLVLWTIVVYNGLVAMLQRVNRAFADIDVQMKQRHDLIPNLVNTVKGYAGHEHGTLEAVVNARNAAIQAGPSGVAAQAAAETALSATLRQLFVLSESYPDLKANQNFQQLQPSFPTSRTSSRLPAASSTMPCRSTTHGSSSSPPCYCVASSHSLRRSSSTSAPRGARLSTWRRRQSSRSRRRPPIDRLESWISQ